MRLSITTTVLFCCFAGISLKAAITPSADSSPVPGVWFEYASATRLIRLADGSDFLIVSHPQSKEPQSTMASFVSVKGRTQDTGFGVNLWIPSEVAEGTGGQIYSAAMSSDYEWIAVVAGWLGAQDHRGHNGIFILHREPLGGFDNWKLKSWFDVRGMTIGEIEFGPDDVVFTTSHQQNPGGPSPILTAFSFAGQKLGSFVDSEHHGDIAGATACRLMRIEKIGSASFALYDPETSTVRFLDVKRGGSAVDIHQTRAVPIAFGEKSFLLAFDILADGRIAIARTTMDSEHHGHSWVTTFSPNGQRMDEWASPHVWQYAYAADHTLNGVHPASPDNPTPVIQAVGIK